MPSMQMQMAPSLLAEQCLTAAAQLVQDAWAPRAQELPTEASDSEVRRLQEVVAGCLGVLFSLHDTGRRPPQDVQHVLQHVLQRVKPLSAASTPEYNAIEATLKLIVMNSVPAAPLAQ